MSGRGRGAHREVPARWDLQPFFDGTSIVTIFIILLLTVPSKLTVAALGGAGSPAQILGLGMLLWWLAERARRQQLVVSSSHPIRRMLFLLLAAVLASYVVGATRAIAETELRSMQMGLLSMLAWIGVVLVTADGVRSMDRLQVVLDRLGIAGGLLALLAIAQFATGTPIIDNLAVPGLSPNSPLISVTAREGFDRPAGTAIHSIELAAVLSMILPVALHNAFHSAHKGALRRVFPAAAIALVIPLTLSRTAIVCSSIVLILLLPTWSRSARRRTYILVAALAGLLYVTVPSLLGTIAGLFTGIGSDTSALSRTGSYTLVLEFFQRSPVFGRGFLTFLPQYRILDNQYLGLLVDLGLLGLATLLGLFLVTILAMIRLRLRNEAPNVRSAAQSLAAGLAAGAASFALFDAFSFPMAASCTFLLIGGATALARLEREVAYGTPFGPRSKAVTAPRRFDMKAMAAGDASTEPDRKAVSQASLR